MSRHDTMSEHLLAQFADSPNIDKLLDCLGAEIDLLDTVHTDLAEKRWINTGEGAQLDGIGEIVGRDRTIAEAIQLEFFGFLGQPNVKGFGEGAFRSDRQTWLASSTLNDASYRLALWQKVFKNTSRGTTEDTIKSLKYIFDCDYIVLEDEGNAKVSIGIGRTLTPSEKQLSNAIDMVIRAGGVGVEYKTAFDSESYFGFLGQPNALGFGEGVLASQF